MNVGTGCGGFVGFRFVRARFFALSGCASSWMDCIPRAGMAAVCRAWQESRREMA